MTVFYLSCAALVLFSGVFFLFPWRRPEAGQTPLAQANLDWLRRRQRELAAEGDEALQQDLQLRLLEEQSAQAVTAPPDTTSAITRPAARFPAWVLLPLLALAAALLYYRLGAAPDVQIAAELAGLRADSSEQELRALVEAVAARSKQRPDNLHYAALLGRHYMAQQQYAQAQASYEQVLQQVPDDPMALAFAAQAAYLAAGRTLSDHARLRAEQSLAADPHQRTALGLLGMASYEQGDYRAAITYWERLLVTEPPGSDSARMIADVVARARAQLPPISAAADGAAAGADVDVTGATGPAADVAAAPGITVQVALPAGADIAPSDTVFVLARPADGASRMPIAVKRLTGRDLPATLRLDDGDAMAGQLLSAATAVQVAVQVSPDGRPGADNASWLGEAGPVAAAVDGSPVVVELSPNRR